MTASTTRRPAAGRSRTAAVAATAVVTALLLAGCGDQTDEAQARRMAAKNRDASAPLFKKLPKDIQDKALIQVGTDATYKPVEFRRDGKIVGIDVDLANAMGKELGVVFSFSNGTFDTLIGGIKSGRYDVAMSAMTDTKERQQGIDDSGKKVGEGVDFVDYFNAGVSIYTKKGETKGIDGWDALCGKTIAVQRGTVSHDLAKEEAKKCKKDDKGDIKIEPFDNDSEAQTRLRTGGVDAVSSDYPVAAYAVQTSGGGNDFEIVGEPVEAAPYGIAVPKDNKKLRDALQAAMQRIIDNGTYGKIMKKWDVSDAAIKEAKINGGS